MHSFKMTYPIIDGKIEKDGIVYFGDGNMGIDSQLCDKVQNNLDSEYKEIF